MQTVLLSDVVLTAKGLAYLKSKGWSREFIFAKESYFFWNYLWVNPDTNDIFISKTPKTERVMISFYTDVFLRTTSMHFVWVDKNKNITEDSELGQLLSTFLLHQFDKVGYISFSENIIKHNINDYQYCKKYILERCEFYNIDFPNDVDIYLMPPDTWTALVGQNFASFYPGYNTILAPDIKWSSENWWQSLLVHEFTHAIQKKKGWLISNNDIPISNSDMHLILRLLDNGFELARIASVLNLDVELLKKLSVLLEMQKNYLRDYFENPFEIHAFTEQFRFLSWLGIPHETIAKSVISYMESLDLSQASRNKGLFERMIQNSDEIISQIVSEQENLYGNPLSDWEQQTSNN